MVTLIMSRYYEKCAFECDTFESAAFEAISQLDYGGGYPIRITEGNTVLWEQDGPFGEALEDLRRIAVAWWESPDDEAGQDKSSLQCEDCGKPYLEFPLDVVIPDDQWQLITGYTEGQGILCAGCIVERGSKAKGFTVAKLVFE